MSANRNKKNNRKTKKSVIIFAAEIIILLALAGGVFIFARVNDGLRNIGSGVASGTGNTANTAGAGTIDAGKADGSSTGNAGTAGNTGNAGGTAQELSGAVPGQPDPNADADAAEENIEVSRNTSLKGYTNIALVGIDTRDTDQIDYANSDTMLIASINNETGKVRMVSIYRDTLLNIGTKADAEVSQGDSDETWDTATDDMYDVAGDDIETYEGEEENYDDGGDDYEGGAGEGPEPENYDDTGDDTAGGNDTGYDTGDDTGYDTGDDTGNDNTGDTGYDDGGNTEPSGNDNWNGNDGTGYDDGGNNAGTDNTYEADTADDGGQTTDPAEYWAEDEADEVVEYANNTEFDKSTISEESNGYTGVTTAAGRYDKANAAYANGSAKQLLSMLNKNLDLNIHDYIVVDFNGVAKLVDDIDGIDVWMTKQEIIHMNNYCVETSRVTGLEYEPIEPEEMPREYHLNGVQAVSYARIRFTTGNDMKRSQRQRVVIQKVVNKAKKRGIQAINGMIYDVFPMCKTSLSSAEIIRLAAQMFTFEVEKTTGFPFEHIEKNVYVGSKKLDAVVPVTLAVNVAELHEFLFDESDYQVSSTVREYSQDIESLSNLTEKSREAAKQNSVIGLSGGEADVVK